VNKIVSPTVEPDRHAADSPARRGTSIGAWHIH